MSGRRAATRLRALPALGLVALGAAAPAQHPVRVTAIDGSAWQGELRGLDPAGKLVVATETGEVARALDELRAVARDGATAPVAAPTGSIVLWSGQTLAGTVRGVAADGAPTLLCAVPPARGLLALPLRTIRGLRTALAADQSVGFADAVQTTSGRDLLFAYKRGDPAQGVTRLTVTVRRFVGEGEQVSVVVEFDGKEQAPQPLHRLYGVVLGSGAAPDPQPGARVTARLAGGAEFHGALVGLDPAADRCVLRLDEGGEVDLPWQHVGALVIRSDRLVYLSDLEPVAVEQTPALSRKWDWLKDRAPAGPEIVLHGERFARGLVLVPRTRLVYDLHRRFDRFEAVVGIDDRAGDAGDAVIRVHGDDRLLFAAEHVQRGAAPQVLRLDVKDVRRLTLEVDFGDNLDFGDHCAFADARVSKDR